MLNYSLLIDFINNLAFKAGEIALSYFQKGIKQSIKEDASIVTEADIAVQKYLVDEINKSYPDYSILGEEEGGVKIKDIENVFVIDPIDGTTSFSYGFPIWGVSIGFLKNGKPLLGAVILPVLNLLFHCDQKKAYLNNKEIRVSKEAISERSVFLVPSDSHKKYTVTFKGKVFSLGSACAHICYVAQGIAVGAILQPHIWDIVGPCAILEKAGGKICYLSGKEINYYELFDGKLVKENLIIGSSTHIDFINQWVMLL